MKCARLNLQERCRSKPLKSETPVFTDGARRYCQKRMINPDHEEDPRWLDLLDRFHVTVNYERVFETFNSDRAHRDGDDLFLTVQTLKFQGDVDQSSKPRTSFKYIKNPDVHKHRMFVKQPVLNNELSEDDRSSQLTCYYYDDYLNYINSDKSRPTSGKSSLIFKGFSNKPKFNKATQVETVQANEPKKIPKFEPKLKSLTNNKFPTVGVKEAISELSDSISNAKITYKRSAKSKSLTISREQSPETVQVIRVDVVCNRLSSGYDDRTSDNTDSEEATPEQININKDRFASKYLLTNTVRPLNQNLGGAKVTLLCKTFKLTDRSTPVKLEAVKDRKFTRSLKHVAKNEKRAKTRK